jgi:prophage antirepressor-like protein
MLNLFHFEGNELRFVDGKPVANDVARILGYADPSNAVNRIVDGEFKGLVDLQTPSGTQKTYVLEEAGIYQLIFKSKLPSAKAFQKWVFEEVLPQIRKTGSYKANSQKQLPQRDAIDYVLATKAVNQMEDCILTRLLKDALVDELSLRQNNNFLGGEKTRYTVVKVRAKELGYTETDIGDGTALGRFVKATVQPVFQENVGRYKVWHYEINDDLDNAIHNYFS